MPLLVRIWLVLMLWLPCIAEQSDNSSISISNSTNSSKTSLAFPTITVGKDGGSLYYTNVSFGTPGQLQHLKIDIVEPYVWVLSNASSVNQNSLVNYTSFYSANSSNTSEEENGSYLSHLDFADSEAINGTEMMDTISFGSLTMENQTVTPVNESYDGSSWALYTSNTLTISNVSFFDTNDSLTSSGCLGIGGRINDSGVEIDSGNFNSNFFFLESLRDAGIIKSSAYSLWLGADTRPYYDMGRPNVPDEPHCGKLILGAVDPRYYHGPLKKFEKLSFLDPKTNEASDGYPVLPMGPILVSSDTERSINVTTEDFLAPVLLDSRYVFSYLPADAIIQIAVQIGAIYLKELDRFLVACDIADMGVGIDFTFGNLLINVPLQDFLMSTYNSKINTTLHFSGGDEACIVTILSNDEIGYNILGGPFLRNVYLAVDHESGTIAIAQARRLRTMTVTFATDISSVTTTTTYLSPLLSSTPEAKAITSGIIPYASLTNETRSLTLSPSGTPSTQAAIPDQFTATVFSNGLISTGRSFYNTYRSSTISSSSSVSSEFEGLSITATESSSSSGSTKHSAGRKLNPREFPMDYWVPHAFSLIVVFLMLSLL